MLRRLDLRSKLPDWEPPLKQGPRVLRSIQEGLRLSRGMQISPSSLSGATTIGTQPSRQSENSKTIAPVGVPLKNRFEALSATSLNYSPVSHTGPMRPEAPLSGTSSVSRPNSIIGTASRNSSKNLSTATSLRGRNLRQEFKLPIQMELSSSFASSVDSLNRLRRFYEQEEFRSVPKAHPKRNLDLTFGQRSGDYIVGNTDEALKFIRCAYLLRRKVQVTLGILERNNGAKLPEDIQSFLKRSLRALLPDIPCRWYNNLQCRLRRQLRKFSPSKRVSCKSTITL
jgi:hypothetical protein